MPALGEDGSASLRLSGRVLDLLPAAVCTCDAGGLIRYYNRRAAELWGCEPRLGESRRRFCDAFRLSRPDGSPLPPDATPMAEALRTGEPQHDLEVIIERQDGSRVDVMVNVDLLRDDDGRVAGAVSVFQDVTERRRLFEESRRNEERLRGLVSALPAAVYTTDREGRITHYNEAAVELWGRRPAVGEDMWCGSFRIFQPDGAPMPLDRCPMAVTLREGRSVRDAEIVVERPDGARRFVLPHPEVLRDASGEVIGAVNMLVDITERKRGEEQLRAANRRKDEFLTMLAHELRNPLSAIGNAVQVARRTGLDEPLAWSAEVIERQVRHLARLIDDLLDVSRLTLGKIRLHPQVVDVGPILNGAVDTVRPLIEEHRHELTVSFRPGALRVEADPVRLEQVVVNLLANAAKYTEPGGRIWLTAEQVGDQVVVGVRDTGVGIPPEKLSEMFELFVQGDRSLARSEGGLGIGLTLVKSLVEMQGGSVTASSAGPGRGSEFTVRLPAVAAPAEAPAGPAVANGDRRPAARILVVDDNVDAARGLARLLKLLGHDVLTARDGPEAIAVAPAYRPDVVLLDIGLPGMDGYEVARRLRDDGACREARIVAVSGYGREDDRRRGREAGFDHHLVKPIDPDALLTLLCKT